MGHPSMLQETKDKEEKRKESNKVNNQLIALTW